MNIVNSIRATKKNNWKAHLLIIWGEYAFYAGCDTRIMCSEIATKMPIYLCFCVKLIKSNNFKPNSGFYDGI